MTTINKKADIALAEDMNSIPAYRRDGMADKLAESTSILMLVAKCLEISDLDAPNGPHGELIKEHLVLCEIINSLESTRFYKILVNDSIKEQEGTP